MPPSDLIELLALAREVQNFLLRAALRVGQDIVELAETPDRLRDRLPVGQRAAEPTMVDEVLGAALRSVRNAVGRLPLRRDEEHAAAAGNRVGRP